MITSNRAGVLLTVKGRTHSEAVKAMAEMWLGILLILAIDFVLVGLVGAIVFVACTGLEWWQDRRQVRRFAEAVARSEFEKAEAAARRAFQSAGRTDLAM